MTEPSDPSDLPFSTPPEVWAKLTSEMRAQMMQMEMGEAQARHAAHRAETASVNQQTWGAGLSTARLLMALNAGAIVAILAFLGSMIESSNDLWLTPLIAALVAFLCGAAIAVGACAVAYFAGSTLVIAFHADILTTKYPYVLASTESEEALKTFNVLRWAGVWACVVSGACAIFGSGAFLNFAIIALQSSAALP